MHTPRLVIDVGMHTGEDTAYYLHRGFRVLAIEANPDLVQLGTRTFATAIAAGRLEILGVGIAAAADEAEFHVSGSKSVWSSFSRDNAARGGSGYRTVRVPCLTFDRLLATHGVPHYLKIDIEGSDRLCLQALQAGQSPEFISLEMDHESADVDLELLARLGYPSFQCIRQTDFGAIHPGNIQAHIAARRRASALGPLGSALRAGRGLVRRWRRPREGDWAFPPGASGPFGESLPGPWLDSAQINRIWHELRDLNRTLTGAGLGDWFDIHAQQKGTGP